MARSFLVSDRLHHYNRTNRIEFRFLIAFSFTFALWIRNTYVVCMWDEKGPAKLYAALKDDILDFIHQAQIVSVHSRPHSLRIIQRYLNCDFFPLFLFKELLANQEDQALLKAYISAWTKFFNQCYYLPKPFAQVEHALISKSGSGAKKNSGEQGILTKVRLQTLYFTNPFQTVRVNF
jgi:hypothetical protein